MSVLARKNLSCISKILTLALLALILVLDVVHFTIGKKLWYNYVAGELFTETWYEFILSSFVVNFRVT